MKMRNYGSIAKAATEVLVFYRVPGANLRPKRDFCKKMGHPSDRCYKTFPQLDPEYWILPNTSRASVAAHVFTEHEVNYAEKHICLTSVVDVEGLKDSRIWRVDSACTSHVTFDRSAFFNYLQMKSNVCMGTKARETTDGIGDIIIKTIMDGKKSHIKLVNVRHITTFQC